MIPLQQPSTVSVGDFIRLLSVLRTTDAVNLSFFAVFPSSDASCKVLECWIFSVDYQNPAKTGS